VKGKIAITEGVGTEEALNIIGSLIDDAFDSCSSTMTDQAFAMMDMLAERTLSVEQTARLHYFRANAWENRVFEQGKNETWEWELPEIEQQIIELRKAVTHEGFQLFDPIRQCQVLTNLANKLNTVGRCVEAMEQWDKALTIEPRFAMAHANRGHGLTYYAHSLYDPGHAAVLRVTAADAYQQAMESDSVYDHPENYRHKAQFFQAQKAVVSGLDVNAIRDSMASEVCECDGSEKEKHYRRWVLSHRLYLNPLNELGEIPLASQDVLTLPSLVVPMDKYTQSPPLVIGFYNQLKQEFVSARYLYYQAIQAGETHYSDKGVLLYNTLDCPAYGLSVEKMRAAYRLAYSLFDKTAYFLNHYLELGKDDNRVNFRNLWYASNIKGKSHKKLAPFFKDRPNWSLRGLFWLSKDLFDSSFHQAMEPDAEELAVIRNHLEHKYLHLHENDGVDKNEKIPTSQEWGYYLSRDRFAAKTLRVLKLSRACLLYLSLATHREEQIRNADKSHSMIAPINLGIWDDIWKI